MGHISVLYEESLNALGITKEGLYVDGTLGGGGHSTGILKRGGRLIGIDKDDAAIERCGELLAPFEDRLTLVKRDFKCIKEILLDAGVENIDGAILDLGVSSFQLDEGERGFSYNQEAPLDMRMDRSIEFSAADVVNEYSRDDLKKILFKYAEEKYAPQIAAKIVNNRPINTTLQLADIVKEAIPARARREGGHPAKRTFQAIRIEVNGELKGLFEAIGDFIDVLKPGGKLAVISFHSLEDRAVKQAMALAERPCTCPPDFPQCICGKESKGKRTPRKPILPGETELNDNRRAHSAKLRVFEKNATGGYNG